MQMRFFILVFSSLYLMASESLVIPTNQQIYLDRIVALEQKINEAEKTLLTQKEELIRLKKSVSEDLNIDSRLILSNAAQNTPKGTLQEAHYFLDGQEIGVVNQELPNKPLIYDAFVKPGAHTLRVEKIYVDAEKKPITLQTQVETILKPGHSTYVDFTTTETQIQYESRVVPHSSYGRTIALAHSLNQTRFKIYLDRNLPKQFKFVSAEVSLDDKKLVDAKSDNMATQGFLLYQGALEHGKHELVVAAKFETDKKPNFILQFKVPFTAQLGFETSIILNGNSQAKVSQEAL